MNGPLRGIRVIEFAGIGPAPHACMMLSDLGAEVVRVERPGTRAAEGDEHTVRGRRITQADLKSETDKKHVFDLLQHADVIVEGYRPGVMERLGMSPEEVWEVNSGLVYARMTGWGQDGPLAERAGHDINYISLTGALHAIGARNHPLPPLNLVGDYGGGSMMLVIGVLAALLERATTGRGQVVDAAMVDGVSVLMQQIYELFSLGRWTTARESNWLDGGAPYYRTYACSDGEFMAVGALEPQFYELFIEGLGFEHASLPDRNDEANWPTLTEIFSERFASHTREYWTSVFKETDACVTPVLSFTEAPHHPHIATRQSVVASEHGAVSAMKAPRFKQPLTARHTELQMISPTGPIESIDNILMSWEPIDVP